jgi:DNA-binding CsgD family transcriptional regulator
VRPDPFSVLTPRQLELLAMYASGYQIDEIAATKFLSYSSVKQTLSLARDRMDAKNLTHLCVICVDSGVIRRNGVGYKPVQADGVVGE